jgi:hypothetical protein
VEKVPVLLIEELYAISKLPELPRLPKSPKLKNGFGKRVLAIPEGSFLSHASSEYGHHGSQGKFSSINPVVST